MDLPLLAPVPDLCLCQELRLCEAACLAALSYMAPGHHVVGGRTDHWIVLECYFNSGKKRDAAWRPMSRRCCRTCVAWSQVTSFFEMNEVGARR